MKFLKMSDDEKLKYLISELNNARDFKKQIEDSNLKWSAYDTSVRVSIDELEWIIDKLSKMKGSD